MLDNFTEKQRKIIIAVVLLIAIGIIWYIFKGENNNNSNLETDILVQNNNTSSNEFKEEKESEKMIIIHIAGGVKNPGVVKLKEGSRIEDAINLSGGLTEDADITNVNLAYILDDGTKINIPRISIEESYEEQEQEIIQEGNGEGIVENTSDLTNSIRSNKYK